VNSGIGFETMRVLALRGARVIGTARTLAKAEAACGEASAHDFSARELTSQVPFAPARERSRLAARSIS
jgi:NAD(P)-dependent dehydrogenase (short-subunit alcohol dehydrogenase family)